MPENPPQDLTEDGPRKETVYLPPEDYTVGWICAIPYELIAARAMLDHEHAQLKSQPKHDENNYILGSIGRHNVAITCLPEYGANRAAIAAKSMQSTFLNVRFGLMVGIGGGVPSPKNDIRLGDVVVSQPSGQGGGVIQYDLGKREIDGFRRLGTLNKPPTVLRTAIANLRATRSLRRDLSTLVNKAFGDEQLDDESDEEWTYPTPAIDILFKASYPHIDKHLDCGACLHAVTENDKEVISARQPRKGTNPKIHYGNIASGNTVVKNGIERDFLAQRDNVICFEMEAAGLMDDFPCVVIRGISDYADSHKNDRWQPYAAAVASAYAKSLLLVIAPEAVETMEPSSKAPSQCIMVGESKFATASAAHTVVNNINYYDFSVVKEKPPEEFHALGQSLTRGRREKAEDGNLHITARRLGGIFASLLPQTTTLIKCYGMRASEIARESTEDTPTGPGFFSNQAGIDATSIWAGATSGDGAIQVHLLACLLARMWSGPEATSIWFELLECRRQEIRNEFRKTGSVPIETMMAVQFQLERYQLAEWDASARAWLRIADSTKSLQQKRLLHHVGNIDKFVNSKPVLYESVINAWIAGLNGMEALLQGSPMQMMSGDMFPALCSWHLYPDLYLLDSTTKVSQNDGLVPGSGILTIGLQGQGDPQGNGLCWSLPLAHLRFYGNPVERTSTITPQGSRLSLEEFNMVILGCILGGWRTADHELENVLQWISKLSKILMGFFDKKDTAMKEESWLRILGYTSDTYLKSNEVERNIFKQLINCGRNYYLFLGTTSIPFFGLSDINRAVSLANGAENKLGILRSQAKLAKLPWDHAIIRYISDETKIVEYASASPRERETADETKPSSGHIRWVHSQHVPKPTEYNSEDGEPDILREDVFFGSDEAIGSRLVPESNPQMQDPRETFNSQKERYEKLGEDVVSVETESIVTKSPPGKKMRVIWGYQELNPYSAWDYYEPWFGEMKHYEYWLGEPESAAIFIRMDVAKPEGQTQISFTGLRDLFQENAINICSLPPVFADAIKCLDRSYIDSLRAFAAMNLLYGNLKQSTIDVRVFEKPLSSTRWFDAVFGNDAFGNQRVSHPHNDEIEDYSGQEDEDIDFECDKTKRIAEEPLPNFFEDGNFHMRETLWQPTANTGFLSVTSALETLSNSLRALSMSREESFSCILLFENCFNIMPYQVFNVMAISSGNSLFIAASILSDPAKPPGRVKIRHVMGNVGRPGTALLVPPIDPRMMRLGIELWPRFKLENWDGLERDSFHDSSLHLWFTGSIQEVDIGYSGAQDKELYFLESVVSLYSKGEWVADLDILQALRNPLPVYRHKQQNRVLRGVTTSPATCAHGHECRYRYEELALTAVESWPELLKETEKSCIILASKNWQARLAAMVICIAQKRRVCLLSGSVCWVCVVQAKKIQPQLAEPTMYIG